MNQTNKTISIGIPTYNQAAYLSAAIESAINQTVKPFEIVVSNNHCTDETDSVLEKYGDKIRVVKPPHHLGMMENWNFLIKQLKGEWFSLISSDDYYEPQFVELFQKKVNHQQVLVRFSHNVIDENNAITHINRLRTVKNTQPFPGNFYEQLSGPKTSFAAFAIKMEAAKKVGYFDETFHLFGDWAMWLNLAPLGSFGCVHQIASNYRSSHRSGIEEQRKQLVIKDKATIEQLKDSLIDKHKLKTGLVKKVRKLHKLITLQPLNAQKKIHLQWLKLQVLVRETWLKR